MKYCRYCQQTKPFSEFTRRAASPDGHGYKCRQCASQYAKSRYATNIAFRGRAIGRAERWRQANPERRAEIAQSWAERNRDAVRAAGRAGNKRRRLLKLEHARSLGRQAAHTRKGRLAGIAPMLAEDAALALRVANGRCVYCLRRRKITIDHFVAVARGSDNGWANLIGCCQSCNSQKGAKDGADWLFDAHGVSGVVRALRALQASRKAVKRLYPSKLMLAVHGIAVREV